EDILTHRQDWIDFGKHVIPNTLKTHRVFSHVFMGYWEDIGTVRSYYETHMQMVRPEPPFQFYDPSRIIYTHPRYLPGAKLENATVKNSIICEGSRIERAEISDSVVGIRSVVHPGVTIDKAILMGADYLLGDLNVSTAIPLGIGRGSEISRAIIDKNACIGERVVIRGSAKLPDQEGDGWAVRDGIVIVMKNAVIPDGTRIE
ncbi:MAG: glucose-phosphate adenylyltransferase, partial [Candidatus Hydrogenedentes bacterium]|nr:glucose-phosphate adenylyltransferase [Candidatus Hydrogenedentota bacterium]